jgi:uncharacterized protein
MIKILKEYEGFDWDKGNINKNYKKHKVKDIECEEVYFNLPLIITEDSKHSKHEQRYYVLGRTEVNRYLFISFTTRKKLIRVISARDMNKKERIIYEQKIKSDTNI